MIDVKSLRIGNIIKYTEDDSICTVLEISDKGLSVEFEKGYIVWIELDAFSPIELTEELLLKCGFELIPSWDNMTTYGKDNFWLDLFGSGFVYNDTEVRTLHHLQNLFYFITNEELILKL